jgi:serine/threonine protein kinase
VLKKLREVARCLVESLCVLRKLNIIHADLKPENILLDQSEFCDQKFKK